MPAHAMHCFESTWVLCAPRERVWEALVRASEWPRWWPSVLAVDTLVEGDACGRGAVRRILWRTALPYLVRIEAEVRDASAPWRLVADARGGLEGTSEWLLIEHQGATAVVHHGAIAVRHPWLRLLSWLLSPLLRWNHAQVMRIGAAGMARHLRCRLLAVATGRAEGALPAAYREP